MNAIIARGLDVPKKLIKWDEAKNQLLQLQRGVSFEDILEQLETEKIIARKVHPNSEKYPNQEIFVLKLNDYIYYVPFVESENEIFLKTIIPSRKLTKEYGG
ncbi:MAG: BrnT family toxin [Campylobacterales bacterium]|nr:BrnT family toxin [Campylobacterales bacterium]